MNSSQRSFTAYADVGSSLFVKVIKASGVNQGQIDLAGADGAAYGVTHEGSEQAPIPGVTPLAASAGYSCMVYGPGDNCEVICAEAINAGDFLKSDSASKAVVAFEGERYFAQAMSSTTATGQKVKVTLIRGTVPGTVVDSVAAAGSAQGDAAALAIGFNTVTAADGTKGVILPTAVAGKQVRVYNSVATNGLKIYPATGGSINGGTANAAITIEGKTFAVLEAVDTLNWAAVFTVNT